jgi:hypothetical protein
MFAHGLRYSRLRPIDFTIHVAHAPGAKAHSLMRSDAALKLEGPLFHRRSGHSNSGIAPGSAELFSYLVVTRSWRHVQLRGEPKPFPNGIFARSTRTQTESVSKTKSAPEGALFYYLSCGLYLKSNRIWTFCSIGWPFKRAGLNWHCFMASKAASRNTGRPLINCRLLTLPSLPTKP